MDGAFAKILFLSCCFSFTAKASEVVRSDGDALGVRIVGTITNAKSGRNVVLLKDDKSGRIHALKEGQPALKIWKLIKVHPKYIMLQKENDFHLIYQNKFAGEFLVSKSKNLKNISSYKEPGFERVEGRITLTEAYRDKMINDDLSKVLMQATAIPYSNKGQVIGFKLLQIDKDSIYDKSGFLNGDIITAINGIDLTSVAGAIKLLQSLRGETALNINYLRGQTSLNIDMRVK